MSDIAIKVENLSKLYQLGEVGTGTISHDLNRWWAKFRGKEDPYAKIGQTNDRTKKAESDFVWALKDINFEVKQGEVLGIIGRNGAGKSTLLKILSKITSPTTGKIYTKGRIASLLEVGTGFHPEMTGRENIYLNGAILGMRKWEIDKKFDEIVDFAGVEAYIDTPVKRYSSGMYVRLAFAVAAFLEPEILIVDEVLAVGDAEFQNKCLGRMKDVSENDGRTVLFVSHNMSAIKALCTSGVLLKNGGIVSNSNVENLIIEYSRKNQGEEIVNNQSGTIDLKNNLNKSNSSKGIVEVEIICNNKNTNIVRTGSTVQFVLKIISDVNYKNVEIGFAFKDKFDENLIGLNNKHLGVLIEVPIGCSQYTIEIQDFPFYNTEFINVNLYFGVVGLFYEEIYDAFFLVVKTEDVYMSGKLLDTKWNKIVINKIAITPNV
jgi:lipopolysaccharide transport system ATP-binding protein